MSFSAPHIGFVVSAYGLSALVIAGLIVALVATSRQRDRRLGELERQGAPRRKSNKQPGK